MVHFIGKVVSPRVSYLDGVGNGWGLYCEGPLFNTAGALDSVGEMTFSNSNINGIFGGIFIEGTDFLEISGVRCSWPSFGGIEYSGEWVGLKVAAGFRQIDVRGFRAASFSTSASATFRMADLNGRSPYEPTGTPGMVNMDALYLSTGGSSIKWDPVISLRNIREATISPPKVRGSVLPAMLYLESDHVSIAPKVNITGKLPYTFTQGVVFGPGASSGQVVWPNSYGIFTLSQVSSAGSFTILPDGPALYRHSFAAGSAPYVYDYSFSNVGAVPGQVVSFYVQMPTTNAVVRFRDEAGGTRLTLSTDGAAKSYRVDCTWLDIAGIMSMRVQFAAVSII